LDIGGKLLITASSPGRCGLVGNPTDMYGGTVISCSTEERATCVLNDEVDEITISVICPP
jgi:galactokinase